MKNMKIRTRIKLYFLIILMFVLTQGIIDAVGVKKINDDYAKNITSNLSLINSASEAAKNFLTMQKDVRELLLHPRNTSELNSISSSITSDYNLFRGFVNNYKDNCTDTEINRSIQNILTDFEAYYTIVRDIKSNSEDGNTRNANNLLISAEDYESRISAELSKAYNYAQSNAKNQIEVGTNNLKIILIIIAVLVVITIVLSLTFDSIISHKIADTKNRATEILNKIAAGSLNTDISPQERGEVGDLSYSIAEVSNMLRELTSDIDNIFKDFCNGNYDHRIDSTKYNGDYKNTADNINKLMLEADNRKNIMLERLNKISKGDFNTKLHVFPNQGIEINNAFDALEKNISEVIKDIRTLASAVDDGNFNDKIDSNKYSGDWKYLMVSVNSMLDNFLVPSKEIASVVDDISKGNFNVLVKGNYKGEFDNLKTSVNNMISANGKCITEILYILTQLGSRKYSINFNQEHLGDFSRIKQQLEMIADILDKASTSNNAVEKNPFATTFNQTSSTSKSSFNRKSTASSTFDATKPTRIPQLSGAVKIDVGNFGYQDDYNKMDYGKY